MKKPSNMEPADYYKEKLIIPDPMNRNNNVGRCTFKISTIKVKKIINFFFLINFKSISLGLWSIFLLNQLHNLLL